MMIKLLAALMCLCISSVLYAESSSINSLQLTRAMLKAVIKKNGSCLRYQMPTRFCIWLSPIAGRNFTPVLNHYLPDVIVAVYRNADENPWTEARLLFDKASAKAQEKLIPQVGSGNHAFLDEHEQQVIFKETEVVGNPGLFLLPSHLKLLLLPSTATPLYPYFQSMLDSLLWRGRMPEALGEETASVALSLTHHVGKNMVDWGGIYPHEGVVVGMDDAQASMVIAARAADLLTRKETYGHLHQSLATSCGKQCHASPITENSKETLFQLVYPIAKDDCAVLGSDESYDANMLTEKGAYVWIVWRHYQGCADGDGKYVGVTP